MQEFLVGQLSNITLAAQATGENSGANESIIILVTGFVVVFLVLLLLIGIIKLYSGIVSSVQNKVQNRKIKSEIINTEPVVSSPSVTEEVVDAGLDLQTVAVITAAVEAFYAKDKKVRITSIRPSNNMRNEWASAGLVQNIPAMRSEGLL